YRHLLGVRAFPTRRSSDLLSTEMAGVKAEVTLLQGQVNSSILSSITKLAQQGKPILLLLDEIQALASSKYKTTIASLRTALDIQDRKSTRLNSSHVKISYA